jgi:DNA-binding PadR family transcriptional regulator
VSDLLTKTFFGGFVRLHVLYHAVREPIFGVEMMEELARHGYDVGPGTLYPLLHQLEQAGFLTVHTELVAGKQRKYYRATSEGAQALDDAKARLRELVKEVLHDDPPTPSIRSKPRGKGPRNGDRNAR